MRSLSPRARRLLPLVLVGASTLFMGATLRPGSPWGGDFAMYILHARNLAEGLPYTSTGYVYDAASAEIGPAAYPPGFPAILAPVVKVFGTDVQPLKFVIVAAHAALLAATWLAFSSILSLPALVTVLLILGFHPWIWDFKDSIVSDLPFAFFLMATLMVIDRTLGRSSSERGEAKPEIDETKAEMRGARSVALAAALGLLIAATYAIRTAGIVLLPVLIGVALLRRRRIGAFSLIALVVAGVLILALQTVLPEVGSYTDQLAPAAAMPVSNAPRYLRVFGMLWSNGVSDGVQAGFAVVLALAAVIGYGIRVREDPGPFEIVVPVYLGLILVWPAFGGTRFVLPILAFALLYALVFLDRAGERLPMRWAPHAVLLAVTALTFVGQYRRQWGPIEDGPHRPEAQEVFAFVREQVGPSEIVLFRKPRVLALFADRRAASLPLSPEPEALWATVDRVGAQWLVADTREDHPSLDEAMATDPRARLEFENGRFLVYRILEVSPVPAHSTSGLEAPVGAASPSASPHDR